MAEQETPREPVVNRVEIFEIQHFDEARTRERQILMNGNLVYAETIDAKRDAGSTSNVKQFIDWLLGIPKPEPIVLTPKEKKSSNWGTATLKFLTGQDLQQLNKNQ